MKRATVITATALATAAGLLTPTGAGAVTIGANLNQEFEDGLSSCLFDPFCTTLQLKVAGAPVKAPFSGRVTRVGMLHPNGTFSMQVMRRKSGGEYKSLRSSAPVFVSSTAGQVKYLDVNERIRKGDYVAIRSEDFGASSFAFADHETGLERSRLFQPGLEDGDTEPPSSDSTPNRRFLYNARIIK